MALADSPVIFFSSRSLHVSEHSLKEKGVVGPARFPLGDLI